MTVPLWILAGFSIIAGLFNLPGLITMEHWLEPATGHHEAPSATLEVLAITLSVLVGIFGILMARAIYYTKAQEKWADAMIAPFARFQNLAEKPNGWPMSLIAVALIELSMARVI